MRRQATGDVALSPWVHPHLSFSEALFLCIHIPPLSAPVCSQGFLFRSKIEAVIYRKDRKSSRTIHVVAQHFWTRASNWTGEKGKEGWEYLAIWPYPPACEMKKPNALNPPLPQCLHGAREQGGLLAALMAFHPPQFSRNSCSVLGQSLQTASSRVTEGVHQTL